MWSVREAMRKTEGIDLVRVTWSGRQVSFSNLHRLTCANIHYNLHCLHMNIWCLRHYTSHTNSYIGLALKPPYSPINESHLNWL